MRLFFIGLLAIGVLNISHAQEFKIESSKAYKKANPNEVYEVVFATPYGFSTYSYLKNVFLDNTKAINITKYDQQLNAFETKTFNLPKLDLRAADLDKVIALETKLIFISNSMSKKKGVREIYAQVYDSETGAISEHQIIASYAIDSYSKSGQLEVNASEDKTKIVVFANLPYVKKTNEKIKTWVFDNQLQPLWSAAHDLIVDSERAHDQDVNVSNDGVVYVTKRHDYNSKKATSTIITITDNSVSETVISEPTFYVRNTSLVNIGTENLIAGYYFEGNVPKVDYNSLEGNATTGVFLYSPNSKKLLGKHPFNPAEGNVKDLTSIAPLHANVIGDDIYLIGEKQTYTSKFKSDKSTDLDYIYTHGPTVITNLDTKGTLKNMRLLYNDTTFKNENSEKSSIATVVLNGGLKLFYNKNDFTISSYFNTDKVTYNMLATKYESGSSASSYLVPQSLKMVDDYNLIYFVATNGETYWLNKMSW